MFEPTTEKTDEEILVRAQGEPWLFAVLLERYQDAFLRKAGTILFDIRDAEEVVQDAFTKIYLNAGRFDRHAGSFSSWGYKILVNTALTRYNKCKREGKRVITLDPEIWEYLGKEENHSGFEEERDGIERVLEKMPTQFAQVLRLHYLERWPQKDIAKEMGKSPGAVKALVHRAKESFKKNAYDYE
ncbi:RNA polymerase sigma factor [Candidatus Kaiserbacteria bacterium]|nr:RNA polymerase sigma factor [Candidatus Kaiserbacteria bacterium]